MVTSAVPVTKNKYLRVFVDHLKEPFYMGKMNYFIDAYSYNFFLIFFSFRGCGVLINMYCHLFKSHGLTLLHITSTKAKKQISS